MKIIWRQTLCGDWQLSHFRPGSVLPEVMLSGEAPPVESIPAQVPGNVALDLWQAGRVPDPYIGFNPEQLWPLEFHEWWYSREFAVESDPPAGIPPVLVIEGIDTFADVFLDGRLIGSVDNMFIAHRIPIEHELRAGERHCLQVRIRSDLAEVADRDFDGVVELIGNDPSRLWIRKPGHAHGWDIFPRALSAGICRPIYLETVAQYSIADVFVFTKRFDPAACTIMARVAVDCPATYCEGLSVRLRLLDGESVVAEQCHAMHFPRVAFQLELARPKLWWPRPYGLPFLYRVEAQLLDGDDVLDRWTGDFGIRSIELDQAPLDAERLGFHFKINGVPISVYGQNHVPLDSFHARCGERMAAAIALLDESRCNMVRVWGGGVYEQPEFYQACDRLGIMVWQEFMFACGLYPQQSDFLEQVRLEA